MENEKNFKRNERATWIGTISNILLTALKFAAWILGRSEAMLAEAVNSTTDIVITLITLIGLKIAKRPRDENHPYGHGKVEAIVEVTIAFFIIAAGGVIVVNAYRSIVEITGGREVAPNWIALAMAILTVAVKATLYRYVRAVAGKTRSPSVRAGALDHLADAFSASTATLGIAGAMLGLPILDPIAGIAVSGFIFQTGYRVLRSGLNGLMDTAAREDIVARMETAAISVPGVISFHKLQTRYVGSDIMADVHIQVPPALTVAEGHDLAMRVRDSIVNKVDGVWDVLVHTEPSESDGEDERPIYDRIEGVIRNAVEGIAGMRGFHDIRVNVSKDRTLVDIDVEVDADLSVAQGHQVANEVEVAIYRRLGENIDDVQVHVDPIRGEHDKPVFSTPSPIMNSDKIEDGIRNAVKGIVGMRGFHDIRVNVSKDRTLVDIDIEVDADASVSEGHRVAKEVERAIYSKFAEVIDDIQVHVDPHRRDSYDRPLPNTE